MKIELDLSEDVWGLIEYIPQDILSTVVADMLKEAICSRSITRADASEIRKSSAEVNQLIEQIKSLVESGAVSSKKPAPLTSKTDKVEKKISVKIASQVDVDIDDFDDEFMGMMK